MMKVSPSVTGVHPIQASPAIEPGVLPIFQLFAGVMAFLLSLGMFSYGKAAVSDYFYACMWGMSCILAAYLRILQRRATMGRLHLGHLSFALGAISIMPVSTLGIMPLLYRMQGISPPFEYLDPSRLYIWLILPLMLISVQYTMWQMVIFCCVTSGLPSLILLIGNGSAADLDAHNTQGVIRLLLFGFTGYVVVRLASAGRRQRAELAEKNRHLAQYATTLEQLATARERNRLARDLHDTLAHTLSAVNIQLKALDVLWETDPEQARDLLRQTQDSTRLGLQEARRALHALRAKPIEELGLLIALKRLAELAAERAGFSLRLELPATLRTFSAEVDMQVYRIAEESLNNIVRHAHAAKVSLCLQEQTDCLQVWIEDDGRGFDTSAVPSAHGGTHYGLVGLAERAMLIGGVVKIESAEGNGTKISLSVPLNSTLR